MASSVKGNNDDPDFPDSKSEPVLITLKDGKYDKPPEYYRRRSTISHLPVDEHNHPQATLILILSQPSHAYTGIGPSLRPIIEAIIQNIKDLQLQQPPIVSAIDPTFDKDLIDAALAQLQIEEFKSFIPLEPSITNFETVLSQGKYTWSLIKSMIHALIGSFLAGYNTSLLNVPAALIMSQININIDTFGTLQTFYCIGGLIGALCAGYIADKYGRRFCLIFANSMFILSGVISLLYTFNIFGSYSEPAVTFTFFIISRVISGIASGISTGMVPTYLGEIAPPIIRGEIGTTNAFVNAFGILFAEIIGFEYILGTANLWKYLFVINIIPGAIQLVCIRSFAESPQWWLTKNMEHEARRVFQWLRESKNVEFDMGSIKTKRYYDEASKITTPRSPYSPSRSKSRKKMHFPVPPKSGKSAGNKLTKQNKANTQGPLLQDVNEHDEYGAIDFGMSQDNIKMAMRTKLLYIFFLTICLQILQQFSGINSIWYYSSLLLQNAGLTSSVQQWVGNVLLACTNFFGVLIPVKLIEKLGRKKLMYLSCLGMIIASIILSIVLKFGYWFGAASGYLSVIVLVFYVISFAVGLGPIVGLLTVELSPSSHRGIIVSIAFFINYSANLAVAQASNYVVQHVYFIPFAAVCALGIVFTYFCLIETKGKKEIDIQLDILEKVSKTEKLTTVN